MQPTTWQDDLMNLDPTTLTHFQPYPFGPHVLTRIPCGGVDRWMWNRSGLYDLKRLFEVIDAACADDAAV